MSHHFNPVIEIAFSHHLFGCPATIEIWQDRFSSRKLKGALIRSLHSLQTGDRITPRELVVFVLELFEQASGGKDKAPLVLLNGKFYHQR